MASELRKHGDDNLSGTDAASPSMLHTVQMTALTGTHSLLKFSVLTFGTPPVDSVAECILPSVTSYKAMPIGSRISCAQIQKSLSLQLYAIA